MDATKYICSVIEVLNNPVKFRDRIVERFTSALPGERSHDSMSSRVRMSLSDYLGKHPDYRSSAVLMMLYPLNNTMYALIIERPTYEGIHSGQLALPGGKAEEVDHDLIATALRETHEEVRVLVSEHEVVGPLTPLYIPPSNFLVQPFVALLDHRPAFIPDEREVKSILEIPLSTFLEPHVKERRRIFVGQNTFIEAPCYVLGENILWGATAMMFSELEEMLRGR